MIQKGRCIMHCGMAAPGNVPGSATVGPIGTAAMKSGSGNYLANLILFPGITHAQHLPKTCSHRPSQQHKLMCFQK